MFTVKLDHTNKKQSIHVYGWYRSRAGTHDDGLFIKAQQQNQNKLKGMCFHCSDNITIKYYHNFLPEMYTILISAEKDEVFQNYSWTEHLD